MATKTFISRAFKALMHPSLILHFTLGKLAPYISNDRAYIRMKYRLNLKRKCDLDTPKVFQEKLQWIKLNDRKPIYHQMVDKIEAKKFIADKIGEEYVIPMLGMWERFEDIDFDALPDRFILKCSFDSGSYYICKDKSKLNKKEIKKHLLVNWKHDYYCYSREWPYKGLKHRILAEPLIADPKELKEYKFFCFNGIPKFYQSCLDRNNAIGGAILNFFDLQGNLLEVKDAEHSRESLEIAPIPTNLDKMIKLSRVLSNETYFLRVDFYEVNGQIYVGEFTFFENGGFCYFIPEKYNNIWGDWIKLPID